MSARGLRGGLEVCCRRSVIVSLYVCQWEGERQRLEHLASDPIPACEGERGEVGTSGPNSQREALQTLIQFVSVDFIGRVGWHSWPVNPALARLNKELKHCKLEPVQQYRTDRV
jgi:hypothetical protein